MKIIFSSSKIYNNVCVNMSSPPRSPSSLNLPPRLSGSVQQSLSYNICFVLLLWFFFVFCHLPGYLGQFNKVFLLTFVLFCFCCFSLFFWHLPGCLGQFNRVFLLTIFFVFLRFFLPPSRLSRSVIQCLPFCTIFSYQFNNRARWEIKNQNFYLHTWILIGNWILNLICFLYFVIWALLLL